MARHSQSPQEQHVTVLIGDDGHEREIHNLGDGISALIVILYPLFMASPGTWVLIEEPETNLHPGFQRIFLQALLNEPLVSKNLRVLLTTHSNHLLALATRTPENISVFSLKPAASLPGGTEKVFLRTVQESPMSTLNDLGVENGSVFLANSTLWVEGPSDRILLTAYIRAYCRQHEIRLLEDIDYAFFLYGGSLVAHYLFPPEKAPEDDEADPGSLPQIRARFISNRTFLLCDKDRSEKKWERHSQLQQLADDKNFSFRTTEPAVEIENTVHQALLARAAESLRSNVSPNSLEHLKELSDEDRQSTGIGKLLNDSGISVPMRKSGSFRTASDKDKFAKAVFKLDPSWDDLGDDARKLTEAIVNFIRSHGPSESP